jgi:hypothetical protein
MKCSLKEVESTYIEDGCLLVPSVPKSNGQTSKKRNVAVESLLLARRSE